MSNALPAPIGVVAHYNLLERLEPAGPGDLFRARDTRLGRTVAGVITGGDVPSGTPVTEQWFLELEREAFLSLCGEPLTLARIDHMLKTGKPLRN